MDNQLKGKIEGFSLDSFLQIVQMDRITCTLYVTSKTKSGTLYFINGELFAASIGNIRGVSAALDIISWENTVIEIIKTCEVHENEINQPLMNILMESMRLRDEAKLKAKDTSDISPADLAEQKPTLSEREIEHPEQLLPSENEETEVPSIPKRSNSKIAFIGLISVLILIGMGSAAYLLREKYLQSNYNALIHRVEESTSVDSKIELLSTYIQTYPGSKLAENAQRLIKDIEAQALKEDLSNIDQDVSDLVQNNEFEKAVAIYEQLASKHAGNAHLDTIIEKKNKLERLLDNQVYETMLRSAGTKGPERTTLYADFLKNHPNSPHRQQVERLISDMKAEFYKDTERRILENEKLENWKQCISISQAFIDIYPYSEYAVLLKEYQNLCEVRIKDADTYAMLLGQGEAMGEDYSQVIKLYTDYLKANPNTNEKKKLHQEIIRVKGLLEKKRLSTETEKMMGLFANSMGRFTARLDGTVHDAKTGLMWCLIDSTTLLKRCMDYQEAQGFVKSLNTGGHTDWRLPTADELTLLYRQKPYFPSLAPTWFWTSQVHKRYIGRWMMNVDVVATETGTEDEVGKKDSWNCGAVRAVRNPQKR